MPWPPTGWKAPSPSWWRPPGSSSRSSLPIQSSYRSWRDLRAFIWTMCLGATTRCRDELCPVVPRTFPPAPGSSASGHRVKAPMDYARVDAQVGVYGALRVRDGHELTFTAPSRNTPGSLTLLTQLDVANPDGELHLVSDHLSRHTSGPIQQWLARHPPLHP